MLFTPSIMSPPGRQGSRSSKLKPPAGVSAGTALKDETGEPRSPHYVPHRFSESVDGSQHPNAITGHCLEEDQTSPAATPPAPGTDAAITAAADCTPEVPPIHQVFNVPPPLVVCLVRHINRDGEQLATPASVEGCVRELQAFFATPLPAEKVQPAEQLPVGSSDARCYPGSCLTVQLGKALDVYSSAGAAVMNVYIYAVDEPTSRPRLLGHVVKAWIKQLAQTGHDRTCIVMLFHKDLVAAAGQSQAANKGQTASVVNKGKLDAAATVLAPYYEELRNASMGPQQMCAYLPNEAPMRIIEQLKTASVERAQRLQEVYSGYLHAKRSMPLEPTLCMAPPPAALPAVATTLPTPPADERRSTARAPPIPLTATGTEQKPTRTTPSAGGQTASPLRSTAAVAASNPSVPTSPPAALSRAASLPTPVATWSIQQLWRCGYDLALHYLQFGLLRQARAIFQALFLEYYINSDDYVFVKKPETLERLGRCAMLFDARRPGTESGKSGYPKVLETKAELLDGLLFIAACEMTSASLMLDLTGVKDRFDTFTEVVKEKLEEMSPITELSSALQAFFHSQCYLSGLRKLWPLCRLTRVRPERRRSDAHPGCENAHILSSHGSARSEELSGEAGGGTVLGMPATGDMDMEDSLDGSGISLEQAGSSAEGVLQYSMVGLPPSPRASKHPHRASIGSGAPTTALPDPLDHLLGNCVTPDASLHAPPPPSAVAGGVHHQQPPTSDEQADHLLLKILKAPKCESLRDAINVLVDIARVMGLVPRHAVAIDITGEVETSDRVQQLRACCIVLADLAVSARDAFSEVGCLLGFAEIALVTHSPHVSSTPSLTSSPNADRTWSVLPKDPALPDGGGEETCGSGQRFGNIDELNSASRALRFWRLLTTMAAVSLRVANQHRREFNLYSRMALTFVEDRPGIAGTIVASRLIPFVREHGWWHIEFFVRRLYVESQDRVLDVVLCRESEWSYKQRESVWRTLFGPDSSSHLLYRECLLFLIGSSEHMLDAAMQDPLKAFAVGSLDHRTYTPRTKKECWQRLLHVDQILNQRLFKGQRSVECALDILLRGPQMWAAREAHPTPQLAATALSPDIVRLMIRTELDEDVYFFFVSRCVVNPLLQSDGVTESEPHNLTVVLESHKDWDDASESTHVIELECNEYSYDASTCQWAARFHFAACHAGTYRLRCLTVHNESTTLSHYPKRVLIPRDVSQLDEDQLDAILERTARGEQLLYPEPSPVLGGQPSYVMPGSLPMIQSSTRCTQPLLYVPEPASGIRLSIRLPKDEHTFADVRTFFTLQVEMEEPLHVPPPSMSHLSNQAAASHSVQRRSLLLTRPFRDADEETRCRDAADGVQKGTGCYFESDLQPGGAPHNSMAMSFSVVPGASMSLVAGGTTTVVNTTTLPEVGTPVAKLAITPPKMTSVRKLASAGAINAAAAAAAAVGGAPGRPMAHAPGTSITNLCATLSKFANSSAARTALRAAGRIPPTTHIYHEGVIVNYGEPFSENPLTAFGADSSGGANSLGQQHSVPFHPSISTALASLSRSPMAVSQFIVAPPTNRLHCAHVSILRFPTHMHGDDAVTGAQTLAAAVKPSTFARTVLPMDMNGAVAALPGPLAVPLFDYVSEDELTPLPLSLQGSISVYPRRECTFTLQLAESVTPFTASLDAGHAPLTGGQTRTEDRQQQAAQLLGTRRMEIQLPVLPIFLASHPPPTKTTEAPDDGPRPHSVSFSCLRGRESCTTLTALTLPFQHAINVEHTFRHLQSRVYCLVKLRNALTRTSLWLRGVLLHVLDTRPSYEVVRVCEPYNSLLEKEWRPQEEHQLLFELSLCPTFTPTRSLIQHRVQVQVFYSDWERAFLTTPAAARLVLRPEQPDACRAADSVHVDSDSDSLGNGASTIQHAPLPISVGGELLPAEGSGKSAYSQRANSVMGSGSGQRGLHSMVTSSLHGTVADRGDRADSEWSHDDVSSTLFDNHPSAAIRYDPAAFLILTNTCNAYYGAEAIFESKHMCLFSAVMYAESPWTRRFGADVNYLPLSAHHRTSTMDSSAMLNAASNNNDSTSNATLITHAMVNTPSGFIFIAGEPVNFCVRLEPQGHNWPEDCSSEEDFFIELHYNPQQWMVIGKQRKKRTLSVFSDVTVTFTAVPLLPPNPSVGIGETTPKMTASTAPGASLEGSVHVTTPTASASNHPTFKGQLAGTLVQDEGILKTPTVKMFWARPRGNNAAAGSVHRSSKAPRDAPATPADGAVTTLSPGVGVDDVLLDLVLFRTWVKVCKKAR